MGRKSTFTQKAADEIVARLSKGEPLTVICRDMGMTDRTVRNWADADDAFASDIARAREAGFDEIALEALRIADDTSNDTQMRGDEDNPYPVANSEWIARSRLRVDTRLKLLAKWDPKRYGERSEHNVNHGVQDSLAELLGQVANSGRPRPGA